MTELSDLQSKIRIDRNRLEVIAEEHASLFFDSAIELEQAKERMAEAESRLSVAEAELFVQIKKDPLAYNLETASDKVAESIAKGDPSLQALKAEVVELKKEVAIRSRFIESLNHRKSMINDLVTLHGQSYFAKPKELPATAQAQKQAARTSMTLPEPKGRRILPQGGSVTTPARTNRPTKPKS